MIGPPSNAELRAASANLMMGRLQSDLDAILAKSWQLRLALRLGSWTITIRHMIRDIAGGIRHLVAEIDAGITHARWP